MAVTKPKEKPKRELKFRRPEAPKFISLKESGQFVEGIFLGVIQGRYGPGYRFRTADGEVILGGNRVQLDRMLADEQVNNDEYAHGTPVGHFIVIMREDDVESKGGQNVAQYAIAHDYERCPFRCNPL